MTIWNTVFFVAAVLATVWTVRLRLAGEPTWKLAGGAASMGFAGSSMELVAKTGWGVVVPLLATFLAMYWIRSFRQEVNREMTS